VPGFRFFQPVDQPSTSIAPRQCVQVIELYLVAARNVVLAQHYDPRLGRARGRFRRGGDQRDQRDSSNLHRCSVHRRYRSRARRGRAAPSPGRVSRGWLCVVARDETAVTAHCCGARDGTARSPSGPAPVGTHHPPPWSGRSWPRFLDLSGCRDDLRREVTVVRAVVVVERSCGDGIDFVAVGDLPGH
jgi:hypothetical protein